MKYLLDVNVLVAVSVAEHEYHERVASWMNESARAGRSALLTCAVTEMGFLRTLVQAEPYGFTIEQGKDLLSQLKSSKESRFDFLADGLGLAQLPRWVRGPKQFTDGHLLGLAKAHGAEMATLDERIPGALVIPSKT
jgi:predicted nucleic acid-binding protein